jgi:hypothetical protein
MSLGRGGVPEVVVDGSLNNLLMFSGASICCGDGALVARDDTLDFREAGPDFGRRLATMTPFAVLSSFDLSLLRTLLPMLKERRCCCYDTASKMFLICCCAKRLRGAAYPKVLLRWKKNNCKRQV